MIITIKLQTGNSPFGDEVLAYLINLFEPFAGPMWIVFIKKNLKFDVLYLPKFLSVYLISLLFWHSAFWYYSEALLCRCWKWHAFIPSLAYLLMWSARHYWMFVGPCCTRFVSYWMLLTLLPCFMTLLYSVMPSHVRVLFSRPKMWGGCIDMYNKWFSWLISKYYLPVSICLHFVPTEQCQCLQVFFYF